MAIQNPRRFKVWDTALLKEALETAVHIKDDIHNIMDTNNVEIEDVSSVSVPAYTLYVLADAYVAAYDALLVEDLLHTGNSTKFTPTIH